MYRATEPSVEPRKQCCVTVRYRTDRTTIVD
jgi:hypothetical protein